MRSKPSREATLQPLYERPGFMIRRAHQIATSIFVEASAPFGATPTQFGILSVLHAQPQLDQITLARRMGLDRSTTSSVLRALEAAGYVARDASPDRRRRTVRLTAAGAERLQALEPCAAAAVERLMEPLEPDEAATLLRLLDKLTHAHNGASRVPIIKAQ